MGKQLTTKREWREWEGPEVEGRLYGIHTLFTSADTIVSDITPEKWPHVFINPDTIEKQGWRDIARLAQVALVTVCVTPEQLANMPEEVRLSCHVMLTITEPTFRLLKKTDSLRIFSRDFVTSVATRNAFLDSEPGDYNQDKGVHVFEL